MKYFLFFTFIYSLFLLNSISAAGSAIKPGQVVFTFNGRQVTLNQGSCIVKEREGQYEIGCGVADDLQRAEFMLKVKLESVKDEVYVDIQNNELFVIFKQMNREGFTLYPPVHYARAEATRHHDKKGRKKNPKWARMTKAERKAKGMGVVKVGALQDARFFLHLVPVFKSGNLVGFRGDFSGIVPAKARSRKGGKGADIKDGAFMLEVQR